MIDYKTDFFEVKDNFKQNDHLESIMILKSKLKNIPKITIFIPTYKRAELLKLSVESALDQVGEFNYEILIVDNNPERNCETEQLLKTYKSDKISYYKNSENIGMTGNWNRGIQLAKGEYVCMLHDDDMLKSSYLTDLLRAIEMNQDLGLISCRLEIASQKNNSIGTKQKLNRKARVLIDSISNEVTKTGTADYLFGFNTYIVGSCFKKELAVEMGGFNDEYFPCQDYYFVVKFQHQYNNVFFLKKKNYIYRIFDNESLNVNTARKFIIQDYFFMKFIIRTMNYKPSSFLSFLNKQYVIYRLKTQREVYGVSLDVDSVLDELGIKELHKSKFIHFVGKSILKTLSFYRTIFKY